MPCGSNFFHYNPSIHLHIIKSYSIISPYSRCVFHVCVCDTVGLLAGKTSVLNSHFTLVFQVTARFHYIRIDRDIENDFHQGFYRQFGFNYLNGRNTRK